MPIINSTPLCRRVAVFLLCRIYFLTSARPRLPSYDSPNENRIVSDTHGLFRPEIAPALAASSAFCTSATWASPPFSKNWARSLGHGVRGNVDREGSCAELPETDVVLIADPLRLHAARSAHAPPGPAAGKFAAVLSGHTHVPNFYTRKGVLYFNPGSCGPRRFRLPVTVGY